MMCIINDNLIIVIEYNDDVLSQYQLLFDFIRWMFTHWENRDSDI